MKKNYVKPVPILMKTDPEFNERWVQQRIIEDPSILGLGQLEVHAVERTQPSGGRLDLLLKDPDTGRRYEVELQLGATDEKHIIRSIEYWDIERKAYPQYDHCAVLVAEDITSRFLNVISLFNSSLPFIAIQMKAVSIGDNVSLFCTTVLDEITRGEEDIESDSVGLPRQDWEQTKASKATVAMADKMFEIAKQVDPNLSLSFMKHYIGIVKNGQADNFVLFQPTKQAFRFLFKHPRTDEIDALIDKSPLSTLSYDKGFKYYRVKLTSLDEIEENKEILLDFMRRANVYKNG